MYTNPFHNINISESSFLITGGAGFIGSHIVEYLLLHDAKKVRVLDNLATGNWQNLSQHANNERFEWIEGDICDTETCQNALKNIDFVSHQAALGSVPRSVKDPTTTNNVNITGFLNILEAAKNEGVKRMVYAASSSTYGDSAELPKTENKIGNPLSPYAVTKLVNELYAGVFSKTYNFHTIGLRYFNVFGQRQDPNGAYAAVIPLFFKAAISGLPPTINGNGTQSRDFTFVANAVEANIKAMLHTPALNSHEVCNIAFGQSCNLNELWEKICMLAGKIDMPAKYGPERLGDVKHSLANIQKAVSLLGYQPQFSLDKGLQLAYDWYKNQL